MYTEIEIHPHVDHELVDVGSHYRYQMYTPLPIVPFAFSPAGPASTPVW